MANKAKSSSNQSDERKIVRSLSITSKAWEAIKGKAADEGVSASEFLERIGLDASVLEAPITSRLKATLELPIPIFWSLSESVRRVAVQLGIIQEVGDETNLQEIEEAKTIIKECLWKAMQILVVVNYAIPEFDINSMTPLLRWMCLKMLTNQANSKDKNRGSISHLEKAKNTSRIEASEIDEEIEKIEKSFYLLKKFSYSYYEIFDMQVLGKMSFVQIVKYKRLNTQRNFTEAEIRREARMATYQLRSYIHNNMSESIDQKTLSENTGKVFKKELLKQAKDYFQLCAIPQLTGENLKQLEEFWQKAIAQPELEFWIREIDHLAGHKLGKSDTAHTNPKYSDMHYEIREELERLVKSDDKSQEGKTFPNLQSLLTAMDRKLMFCRIYGEIKKELNSTVGELSNRSVDLEDILSMKSKVEPNDTES